MAELIERLLVTDANGALFFPEPTTRTKIALHLLQAILAEWARGKITAAQALDALEAAGPPRLSAAEQTEAQNIVNLVTGIAVSGSAAAIADGKASRALKIKEIEDVLYAMEQRVPLYSTPAEVRSKLGIAA